MTPAKENTNTDAGFTQDDYNGLVYGLWETVIDEMENPDSPDMQEGTRVRKQFAELTGVTEASPLAIGYFFFWAGVGKGMELLTRLQGAEPADAEAGA